MQIRFDFDTDVTEREKLQEKLQEIRRIEEMVRTIWENANERTRKRLLKENERWFVESDEVF